MRPVHSLGRTLLDRHEMDRFVSLWFLEAASENQVAADRGEKGEGKAALWGSTILHTG